MKKTRAVRAIVASVLSTILGLWIHSYTTNNSALGKEGYLKKEAMYYDASLSHPSVTGLIIAILIWVTLFVLYELICYLVLRVIDKSKTK
jgi:hypothetical protein